MYFILVVLEILPCTRKLHFFSFQVFQELFSRKIACAGFPKIFPQRSKRRKETDFTVRSFGKVHRKKRLIHPEIEGSEIAKSDKLSSL